MYGYSQALPYKSATKQDLAKNREHKFMFMESDSSTTNCGQGNSGLSRFRSAPSSLLENFASGVDKKRLGSIFASDEENRLMGKGGNGDGINGVCRYSSVNSQLPPQYPRQGGGQFGYLSMTSMGNMNNQGQGGIGSGLMRQNSSPAGLFSHLPSQSGMLSRITEVENENCIPTDLDEGKDVSNNSGDNLFYNPQFQFGSWKGSLNVAENFTVCIKRELDNDHQLFGDSQNMEPGNRQHMLTHHLSLPNTSAEMATMEKLLHLQDSVPCKIRAKRGCATHPRSIAERVRRTRISERMRKLQDLVPNMDKQTNTSDMLDLAVEYIKNLQKEYKTLSEYRANCKCSGSQKTVPNQ